MADAERLSSRDIWLKAGMILAEYGDGTTGYLNDRLDEAFGDMQAIEDWRRIAAAVDYIANAGHERIGLQKSHDGQQFA